MGEEKVLIVMFLGRSNLPLKAASFSATAASMRSYKREQPHVYNFGTGGGFPRRRLNRDLFRLAY